MQNKTEEKGREMPALTKFHASGRERSGQ